MESRFSKFRFSVHFNRLTYLGMWPADRFKNKAVKKLLSANRMFWYCIMLIIMTLQLMDLYFAFGNLRKVTFNLCTSIIVILYAIKIYLIQRRRDCLNELRLGLWQDSLKYCCKEDVALQDLAYTQLKHIEHLFYTSAFVFMPTLFASSYFGYRWGERELPFAIYLPMSDTSDDAVFLPALLFEGFCSFYFIIVVIEHELSIFGLIFQINVYYSILIKDISKINEVCAEDEDVEQHEPWKLRIRKTGFKNETNAYFKRERAKSLLKTFVIRHLELIHYTQKFEYIYSRCLFLQILGGSALIVMNSIELSLYLHEISVKLCFQTSFVCVIMLDILLYCKHLSELSMKCVDVGNALYSTVWYRMDPRTMKDLCLIMVRSREPPRLTAGKLFLMDLRTYLHLLRNIYSWLMLMRQVMEK